MKMWKECWTGRRIRVQKNATLISKRDETVSACGNQNRMRNEERMCVCESEGESERA